MANQEHTAGRARAVDMLVALGGAVLGGVILPEGFGPAAPVLGGLAIGALWWWFVPAGSTAPRPGRRLKAEAYATPQTGILSSLPVPILLIDSGGVVTFANPQARRLLARDLAGQPISLIFRAPAILTAVEEALADGLDDTFRFRVRQPREMMLSATIRTLPADQTNRIALVLEDVTSGILQQETRSDFVANASHELRTPLAAISGLVETLQGAAKDDPAAQERFLGMIGTQTDRMTRLVNDLLSLSRIESDENILPATQQDVSSILSEALASIQPLIDASGAEVSARISPLPMPVRGSRGELGQVFVNLIENAVKYAGDAGPITVVAEPRGPSVCITVTDTGAGIDPELIPRLTERFFRIETGDNRTRAGTGLGLAIVKHIVNRHRGTLDIRSVPGRGADFTVCLPLAGDGPVKAS